MPIHQTPWTKGVPLSPTRPSLAGDMDADVVIVGGGIMGVMAAYQLSRAGKRVILLEKRQVGEGETSKTTAFLSYPCYLKLQDLCRRFGRENATRLWLSRRQVIDEIEAVIRREGISCEFARCPMFLCATGAGQQASLPKEYDLARSFKFPVVYEQAILGQSTQYQIRVEGNARLHPLKFVRALAVAAERYGVVIYEHSPVLGYEGAQGEIVRTEQGRVRARQVINTTHDAALADPCVLERIKLSASRVVAASVPQGLLSEGLYRDLDHPQHEWRVEHREQDDLVLLAGEEEPDLPASREQDSYQALISYLSGVVAGRHFAVTHDWTGHVVRTPDGLPFVGRVKRYQRHIVSVGCATDMLTFGALAGMLAACLATGQDHPCAGLFSPHRFHTPCGSLVRSDRSQRTSPAVFPEVTVPSRPDAPLCAALGCVVQWNPMARTWDCPRHGCRFDVDGSLMAGPSA